MSYAEDMGYDAYDIMKQEIKTLAAQLYLDLPFYKRRKVCKYYKSNNWDVTHEWEQCVKQAWRMVEEADYILKSLDTPHQDRSAITI